MDTDTFMQWARAAGVWHPKVVAHQCPETGLRGLRTTADVADGEVFLKVPLALCVRDDGGGGPLLDAWQTRLALRLMNARRAATTTITTTIGPYAAFLADASTANVLATSLPVHWPDELLELAGDVSAGVEQEARHARAWRDDQWQLLLEVQHPCDRAEYDWALDVVQTRNCRVQGTNVLAPVFDLMNHNANVNSVFDVVVEEEVEGEEAGWLCVRYQGHGVAAGGNIELNYRTVGDNGIDDDDDDDGGGQVLTGVDYMLHSYGFVADTDGSSSNSTSSGTSSGVDLFLPRSLVNKVLMADLATDAATTRWSLVARAARQNGVRLGGPFAVYHDGVAGSLMHALRMLAYATDEAKGDADATSDDDIASAVVQSDRWDAPAMTTLLGILHGERARLADAAAAIASHRHQAGADNDVVTQQRLDLLTSLVDHKCRIIDGCGAWATTYRQGAYARQEEQQQRRASGAVFLCRTVLVHNAAGGVGGAPKRSMATLATSAAARSPPDSKQTLVGTHERLLVESKSKFIAKASHVPDLDAAMAYIKRVSEPGASHNCWAYRGRDGTHERCSDDGEPGGTAGKPILAALEAENLTDVVVVVVRYFGGTKLGFGGLVRAYGASARSCLQAAEKRTVVPSTTLTISVPVAATGTVYHVVERCAPTAQRVVGTDNDNDNNDETESPDEARLTFTVPTAAVAEIRSRVADACKGQASFHEH